ncbi:hypothetical protein V6N11_046117 [Hibiscus sabdariffa]|uniref:Uncharacterized protein n=1 Tax=Hibiscus sabdariffa TaxID=183260 RepID=A0ABR1ZN65_9ROSI
MQNLHSPLWNNVEASQAVNRLLAGNQSGRPPDEATIVDVPIVLERQGSPVLSKLQPLYKKGRSGHDSMMVEDTSPEGLRDTGGRPGGSPSTVLQSEVKEPSPPLPSFKDKLLGNSGFSKQAQYVEELDVEVWEEDVRIEDELVVMAEGLAESMITKPGVEGVAMEVSGSEKRRVGGVLEALGLENAEDVGSAKEGIMWKQGLVASQGIVVSVESSLDNEKHSLVQVVHTGNSSVAKTADVGGRGVCSPPSVVSDLVELEQRRWEESALARSSQCLRVDPGG